MRTTSTHKMAKSSKTGAALSHKLSESQKLGEMLPAAAETLLVDVEWQCPFTEKERQQHIYWYQLNYDSSEMAIEGILDKV